MIGEREHCNTPAEVEIQFPAGVLVALPLPSYSKYKRLSEIVPGNCSEVKSDLFAGEFQLRSNAVVQILIGLLIGIITVGWTFHRLWGRG